MEFMLGVPVFRSMGRQTALPPNLPPRLISREAAAAYVSVAPATFDEMVADGRMPPAKRLSDRRIAWDVRRLDAAIDLLPDNVRESDLAARASETWADVDAAQTAAIR